MVAVATPAWYCTRTDPQTLPVHTLGAAQSVAEVATVQLTLHMLAAESHRKPPGQVLVTAAAQVPAPLHARGAVSTAPVGHRPAAHDVPLEKNRQALAPLQVPSVPQLIAP